MKKKKLMIFYGKHTAAQTRSWIPYNILYLTAPLAETGFAPVFIDEYTTPAYESVIKENAADSVAFGVSAFTGGQITSGLKASALFRKFAPGKPVLWGGHHAKALPRQTLEHELVDIVCTGSGEEPLAKVLTALEQGGDLHKIPGLLFKEDGKMIATGRAGKCDFAKLPPFPFQLVEIAKYINPKTRVLNYTASCGCPGCCSFCPWHGRHPWSPLPLSRILDDIERLVREYRVRTIWLSDANFFVSRDFVLEFARGLKKRGLAISWYALSRIPDLIKFSSAEMIELEESGLVEVFVGIEQTTPRMKKLLRKTFHLEDVDTVLQRMRDLDITLRLAFLCGLPTETLDDLEANHRNFMKWRSLKQNIIAQAGQYNPYPGNDTFALAIKEGMVPPRRLEDWANFTLLPNSYRNSTEEANIWIDVPWFTGKMNALYRQRFLEYFPRREGITFKEDAHPHTLTEDRP